MIAQLFSGGATAFDEIAVGGMAVIFAAHLLRKLFLPRSSEFATKVELDKVEAELSNDIDRLQTRLDTHIGALDEKISTRFDVQDARRSRQISDLHEKIAEVDAKVERILGKLEVQP
jgi:hypothetical protein